MASARCAASTASGSVVSGFCTEVTLRPFGWSLRDDFGPARAVGKKAVHQDDVAGLWRGLRGSGALEKRTGRPGSHHAHEACDDPSE
jgi:hypothetical protein